MPTNPTPGLAEQTEYSFARLRNPSGPRNRPPCRLKQSSCSKWKEQLEKRFSSAQTASRGVAGGGAEPGHFPSWSPLVEVPNGPSTGHSSVKSRFAPQIWRTATRCGSIDSRWLADNLCGISNSSAHSKGLIGLENTSKLIAECSFTQWVPGTVDRVNDRDIPRGDCNHQIVEIVVQQHAWNNRLGNIAMHVRLHDGSPGAERPLDVIWRMRGSSTDAWSSTIPDAPSA